MSEGQGIDPPKGIIGWIWWAFKRWWTLRKRS